MAATLTKAMLDDLHRGNAAISLLAYTTGGVTYSSLDFSAADQIFTIKDSFNISQDDPTVTEIKIDQGDATIDTDTEKGDWTLTGNIPSVATALLEYFYTKAASSTISGSSVSIKGNGGASAVQYQGAAFFADPKEVHATVMIESASKKTAIIFAHVKFTAAMAEDDNNNPLYIKFTGSVLTNTKANEGDFAVLKAKATA